MKAILIILFISLAVVSFGQYCNGQVIKSDTVTIYRVGMPKGMGYLYHVDYNQHKRLFRSYTITDSEGNRLYFKSAEDAVKQLNGQIIARGHRETEGGTKTTYRIVLPNKSLIKNKL